MDGDAVVMYCSLVLETQKYDVDLTTSLDVSRNFNEFCRYFKLS